MMDETRVVDTTSAVDAEVIPINPLEGVKAMLDTCVEAGTTPEAPPVVQDEKIVVLQLITPTNCSFICLPVDENNNKFEIGIMRR